MNALLEPRSFAGVRGFMGTALHWRYRLFRARKHRLTVIEHVQGRPFVVTPGVLNPRLMRTGDFFASQLPALVPHSSTVLDMGTGSGVCAVAVAGRARHVVAVDIAPEAVRCARVNSLLNDMEEKIEIHCGDLFVPVDGRRFDVVLFNPPFIRALPTSDADRAWRSEDVAERFAADLGRHLTPAGVGMILLSTFGDPEHFLDAFRSHRFDLSVVAEKRYVNETLVILRVSPG